MAERSLYNHFCTKVRKQQGSTVFKSNANYVIQDKVFRDCILLRGTFQNKNMSYNVSQHIFRHGGKFISVFLNFLLIEQFDLLIIKEYNGALF